MSKKQFNSPATNAFDAYVSRWHKNMGITEILDTESADFVRARKSFHQADETPIVVGASPFIGVYDLWEHKRDIVDLSAAFKDGRDQQLVERGRQAYADRSGIDMTPCVMRRGDYVGSVDGRSEDGSQIIDILPLEGPTGPIAAQIQEGYLGMSYRMKIEHLLFVSQAKAAFIWLYQDDHKGKMTVLKLTPNNVNLSWMIVAWEQFQKHVETGKCPDWDKIGRSEM